MKTTTPHEGNLRAERIENFVIQFFCMPCLRLLVHVCTTAKKRAPRGHFFQKSSTKSCN